MKHTAQSPLDIQRLRVLEAALPHVVFDGWSDVTLARAAEDAHIDATLLPALFPQDGLDAVTLHSRVADDQMADHCAQLNDFSKLPVPVKVRTAVLARFEQAQPHKEAVRQGLTLLSWPTNSALALKLLSETCDRIWQLAGDQATDFNWYTKRITLAGIYSATLLYWLNDESDSLENTAAFLDRRLSGVRAFGKWKADITQRLRKFSPLPQ